MKKLSFLIILMIALIGCTGNSPSAPATSNAVPIDGEFQGIFYWTPVAQDVEGTPVNPDGYIIRCKSISNSLIERDMGMNLEVNMYDILPLNVNDSWNCYSRAYSADGVRMGNWSDAVVFKVEGGIIK